ncbi:MAG TPA: sensor histidine kinase [Roseiflexaceae bacterium]|nr:sensor histidine kinase [Roseiflexaceae bacterium]
MNKPVVSPSAQASWERWEEHIITWLPYVSLATAGALSLVLPGQGWQEGGWTAALAALAALWVYLLHTRAPAPRDAQRWRMAIYFVGLLALGAALMLRERVFFVFALTGFFHAALLRPWPLTVAGVAATSVLINTIMTGFPWPTSESWIIFSTIIVAQTCAIGFGMLTSIRMGELSEQRREAVARLEAAQEENAGLHAQLLVQAREAGVLDERQRLAREIHDTLAQGLTGIITQLEAAERTGHHAEQWRRHLGAARTLARTSLSEARRAVHALDPEPLETVALPQALAGMARAWEEALGAALHVEVTGTPRPLLPEIEASLFRVAQECLTNVVKHAQASRVGVTLSYMEDVVVLDVRDDGTGFDPAQLRARPPGEAAQGYGLQGMERRLQRVAGSLAIESAPGEGTAISVAVPAISRAETGAA